MYKGIYDFSKPLPFLPTFHGVREGGIGIGESAKLPRTRANKKYPTYIHPPTVGIIYLITKNFPKLLAAYFHYFRNVYSPTLPPNSPTIIPSDEYPTPTYIFNLHILPKLFAAYIQHKDIFKIYIFTNHAPEGHTETNQLTFIPPTVGMIYPIPTYIFN